MSGQVVAFGFNGIFVFIGDADQASAARQHRNAQAPALRKTLALICAPDYLDEFVDSEAPALRWHPFAKIQQLQRDVYCLGVIVPAAKSTLPAYVTHNGTLLNVWMEYPPDHPGRYVLDQIRRRGKRAFAGSSANLHGEPTYVDPLHMLHVFGGELPAVVAHDLRAVPPERRRSSTLVDFTGAYPRLVRQGSVSIAELCAHMDSLGLRRLVVPKQVPHT